MNSFETLSNNEVQSLKIRSFSGPISRWPRSIFLSS